ncbi:MAG: hypothetical protein A3D92_12470 [Bacteroidetes bacterium RIFCSPHIGHO2_02_FULL_44_7]|nr:MAG: hypothetical protein A3D92_12470 [Bacteroidetes bacterium RIFCSPHIGHO2_02_FULL_44_7]
MTKRTLIIQGGGFRTAFSAGVLDAFQTHRYNPFDAYVAVSGGAIALSYYLSEQYKKCVESMCLLAEDKHFMSWNRLISSQGIMDVDYFRTVAEEKVPFDLNAAIKAVDGRKVAFVLTHRESGNPHYYQPNEVTWVDAVIATCTLPFVTKGKHTLHGEDFFDGGWSDPLPVEWVWKGGAEDIVLIRTTPADMKVNQSWPDYLATFIFRGNERLRACFEENHLRYNAAIDFLGKPPKGLRIQQIAPSEPLQTGTYSNNVKLIIADYRNGLEAGLNFLMRQVDV